MSIEKLEGMILSHSERSCALGDRGRGGGGMDWSMGTRSRCLLCVTPCCVVTTVSVWECLETRCPASRFLSPFEAGEEGAISSEMEKWSDGHGTDVP